MRRPIIGSERRLGMQGNKRFLPHPDDREIMINGGINEPYVDPGGSWRFEDGRSCMGQEQIHVPATRNSFIDLDELIASY